MSNNMNHIETSKLIYDNFYVINNIEKCCHPLVSSPPLYFSI